MVDGAAFEGKLKAGHLLWQKVSRGLQKCEGACLMDILLQGTQAVFRLVPIFITSEFKAGD